MKEDLENTKIVPDTGSDLLVKPANEISRRKFLRVGALSVGAAGATVAATGGLGLLTGSFAGAATPPATCATVPGTVKHPRGTWGYPSGGLDPDACAERAYHGFFKNACCWAVCDGVIGMLQDELGSPYTNIDMMAFKFGFAGINGWGTVCGTALGAGICTNMIAGIEGTNDRGSQMSSDLMGYYAQTSMPEYIPVSSEYATRGGTNPAYMPGGTIPTSVADSPLCHVSVGKWMSVAGVTMGSIERKERCARLAATMAKQTVALLNAWKAGTYAPGGFHASGESLAGRPSQYNCSECHI